MFAKEDDYSNLNTGSKITIFARDPAIQLERRKGKYTIIKYADFRG